MVAQTRRPSHSRHIRSNLHRARPARANPASQDISDPGPDHGAEEAHTSAPDELELHRRLHRRNTLPSFLIPGLTALVLAGGLVLLLSRQDGTKPDPSPVATSSSVSPPALDPKSGSTPTVPE